MRASYTGDNLLIHYQNDTLVLVDITSFSTSSFLSSCLDLACTNIAPLFPKVVSWDSLIILSSKHSGCEWRFGSVGTISYTVLLRDSQIPNPAFSFSSSSSISTSSSLWDLRFGIFGPFMSRAIANQHPGGMGGFEAAENVLTKSMNVSTDKLK